MKWLDENPNTLLTKDVDDVIDRARELSRQDRVAAIRSMIDLLQVLPERPERLRALRFIQVALAKAPDRSLSLMLVDSAAGELSRIVTGRNDDIECKRAALD